MRLLEVAGLACRAELVSRCKGAAVISPDRGRPAAFGRGRRPSTASTGRCWPHSSCRWCPLYTNIYIISLLTVTIHSFCRLSLHQTPLDSITEGQWTPMDMATQVHGPPMDLTMYFNGHQVTMQRDQNTCRPMVYGPQYSCIPSSCIAQYLSTTSSILLTVRILRPSLHREHERVLLSKD